jgi:hypothetical protein
LAVEQDATLQGGITLSKYRCVYSVEIEVPVDLDRISDKVREELIELIGEEDDAGVAELVARQYLSQVLVDLPFKIVELNPKSTEED